MKGRKKKKENDTKVKTTEKGKKGRLTSDLADSMTGSPVTSGQESIATGYFRVILPKSGYRVGEARE